VDIELGIRKLFAGKHRVSGRVLTEHHIVLIAGLRSRPGRENELRELLRDGLEPSRADQGCIAFDLHQSAVDPELFCIYQLWQDETALEAHMHTEHAQIFKTALPGLLEGRILLNKWRIVE
jgi:quinol monooxygenase YgiN